MLFGVFLVIDGMMTLQDGVDCARTRLAGWWVPALLGAVTIALGCVVLFGKFDSIMLLAGISDMLDPSYTQGEWQGDDREPFSDEAGSPAEEGDAPEA